MRRHRVLFGRSIAHRALCWVVLCVALGVASPLAWAQEPAAPPSEEDKAKAQALYDEAVKLYQEGKLEESAQTLEQAYGHDPNAVLAYNIGKAYDDAADLNKAETWYRKALESEELGDEERRKATKAVERIEKVKAQLSESEADKAQAEADRAAAEAERQRIEEEKVRIERELAEATAGRERHDGLLLRLLLGFEIGGVSSDLESDSGRQGMSAGGGAVSVAFAAGWAFWDFLAVHVGTFNVTFPSAEVNVGAEQVEATGPINVNGGPAIGATYFLMPLNLFFSLSFAQVTLQPEVEVRVGARKVKVVDKTDAGWGFELNAGKEWWLSDNWGLGLAGTLHFAKVPNPTERSEALDATFVNKFTHLSFGLVASITYN